MNLYIYSQAFISYWFTLKLSFCVIYIYTQAFILYPDGS